MTTTTEALETAKLKCFQRWLTKKMEKAEEFLANYPGLTDKMLENSALLEVYGPIATAVQNALLGRTDSTYDWMKTYILREALKKSTRLTTSSSITGNLRDDFLRAAWASLALEMEEGIDLSHDIATLERKASVSEETEVARAEA